MTLSSGAHGGTNTVSPHAAAATAFHACKAVDPDPHAMLECVSSSWMTTVDTTTTTGDRILEDDELRQWLLVLCGSLVFFMQTGFAMLCAGCVQKKNVQNSMLKNLLDAVGAAVAFYAVGYAFAFGGQNHRTDITFVGIENFFLIGSYKNGNQVDWAFWFFQYAFSAASVTIVAGTLAERCQMYAYLWYSVFLVGFVYPVVAHTIWSNNGFLSIFASDPFRGGAIDFSGSGVVHVTGGMTALIATKVLGPRRGRFHDLKTGELLENPKKFPGHSIALQLMGTLVLWFGWYGFNPGSALLHTAAADTSALAALAAVNSTLSAAAGGITALIVHLYLELRRSGDHMFSLTIGMNGVLSGLVAITAGCGVVENWAALLIGAVAGLIYLGGHKKVLDWKLDDAVDAIPVHLSNGSWGLIATGLLASPSRVHAAYGPHTTHAGWFYSWGRGGSMDATLLGNNILALLFISAWALFLMYPFFLWLNYMGWLRVASLEEMVGLDLAYHKEGDNGDEKHHEELIKIAAEYAKKRESEKDMDHLRKLAANVNQMRQQRSR